MAHLHPSTLVHRHKFGTIAIYTGSGFEPDEALIQRLFAVQRTYFHVFGRQIQFEFDYHVRQMRADTKPFLASVKCHGGISNRRGKTWQEAVMGALHELGWRARWFAFDMAKANRLDDAMQTAIDDLWSAIGAAAEALNASPEVWSRTMAEWS